MMKRNYNAHPAMETLNSNVEDDRELGVLYQDSEVLHGTRIYFVQFIEAADFYLNSPTKQIILHAFMFYPLVEQLLQKLYLLFDGFNVFITTDLLDS